MKNILLTAASLAALANVSAQEHFLTPYDAGISVGQLFYQNVYLSTQDWEKLSPGSQHLFQSGDGYETFGTYSGGRTDGTMYGLQAQFLLPQKSQTRASRLMWGFSLSKSGGSVANQGSRKFNGAITDTLHFSSDGHNEYLHSDSTHYYTNFFKSDRVAIGTRMIYHTNPAAIVSFYGGLALQAGVSTYATVEHYDHLQIETYLSPDPEPNPGPPSNYYYFNGTRSEQHFIDKTEEKEKMNLSYGASVPVGMTFRLGKKNLVMSRLAVDLEFSAGLVTTVLPKIKSYTAPNYTGLIRLNYRFNV